MKVLFPPEIEQSRLRTGEWGSPECAPFGAFFPVHDEVPIKVIMSTGDGWDHVSVSTETRCPTWEEMHWVKQQFFLPEEAVIQIHPPQSDYKNLHPYCLHLWRPQQIEIPLPPSVMVA